MFGMGDNKTNEQDRAEKDILAQSYHSMKQNKAAWDHLMKVLEELKESSLKDKIDVISVDQITVNNAIYVKAVRETVSYVFRKIEEASQGG